MNRNVYHAWDWAGENWSVEFHFRKAVGLAAVLSHGYPNWRLQFLFVCVHIQIEWGFSMWDDPRERISDDALAAMVSQPESKEREQPNTV